MENVRRELASFGVLVVAIGFAGMRKEQRPFGVCTGFILGVITASSFFYFAYKAGYRLFWLERRVEFIQGEVRADTLAEPAEVEPAENQLEATALVQEIGERVVSNQESEEALGDDGYISDDEGDFDGEEETDDEPLNGVIGSSSSILMLTAVIFAIQDHKSGRRVPRRMDR
jgi:hypothetical protein